VTEPAPAPAEPTPDPAPTAAELDQAVIDAGFELARAELAQPRDPLRVAAARQALIAARTARWPGV
jgi:hypothetical protein